MNLPTIIGKEKCIANRHQVSYRCERDLTYRTNEAPFQVSSVSVCRRGEISFACDSLAISRRIYAFTTTPHSSLHRWQYRAPQGSLPLLELSRI